MENYIPEKRETPELMRSMPTAWGDIPTILKDIIERFEVGNKKCIEFGVEFGYSTSALANYFEEVIGIDTFEGDVHAGIRTNHFQMTSENLSSFPNIKLVESTYQDYCKEDSKERFDFAHVDIVHTYEDTFSCGDWCVARSKVTIFHDTESYPEVKRAVTDLAKKHNAKCYNYLGSYGLGIIVK
jgi:predicted O-methyltransferase YrrM